MKKKFLVGLAVGFLMLRMFGMAQAVVIVDTGFSGVENTLLLYHNQWSAGEFSISQDYTITDLEGYLTGTDTADEGGPILTAAIYAGGYDTPVGTALFFNQFSVGALDGWYGASDQSWFLLAGTYWAAFEVRESDTYYGPFWGSATDKLENEAFNNPDDGWMPHDDLFLSIRISGDASNQVPEPATMLLLGFGLTGIVGLRRRIARG